MLATLLVTHDNIQRLFGIGGVTSFPDKMANIHHLKSHTVAPGTSAFIGDSITQRMSASFLGSPATNYGISWARTTDVIRLIPRLENLDQASRIYILIGINDFAADESDGIERRLETIADMLPPGVTIVWSGIQLVNGNPKTNKEIVSANLHISRICAEMTDCTYIDLPSILQDGGSSNYSDEVHLSKKGYSAWQEALKGTTHTP